MPTNQINKEEKIQKPVHEPHNPLESYIDRKKKLRRFLIQINYLAILAIK